MNIKAVIWDVGGVLVRTEDYSSREQLAKRLGYSRLELEDLVYGLESGRRAQLGEIPLERHWENVLQFLGLGSEELGDFQNRFWAGDYLDSELIDFIRSLRRTCKTGLLSNAFSDLRYLATQVWKIADAFDQMIISAEVGLMKPDARIYQLAVRRLGVQPAEAVFIDDFIHNVEAARMVNLLAIHFKTPTQTKESLAKILRDGVECHE
jgi:HAD superfamily hydrolase (TIGR01549 family)